MEGKLGTLENAIGYKFRDISLLERALTHRSWAYEQASSTDAAGRKDFQNETLEFVGDSVLGLAIAEKLYLKNPELSEGDLTVMKHKLVSAGTCASVADALGIGVYLRLSRGEDKSGGRRKHAILADALEAMIGAVFFDGGYVNARNVVVRLFADLLRDVDPDTAVDYKSLLQETLQAQKRGTPKYSVLKTEGPSHRRTFFVEAVWDNGRSEGHGVSIKSAEMEAASKALEELGPGAHKQSETG